MKFSNASALLSMYLNLKAIVSADFCSVMAEGDLSSSDVYEIKQESMEAIFRSQGLEEEDEEEDVEK